jgi:hypothetical protein
LSSSADQHVYDCEHGQIVHLNVVLITKNKERHRNSQQVTLTIDCNIWEWFYELMKYFKNLLRVQHSANSTFSLVSSCLMCIYLGFFTQSLQVKSWETPASFLGSLCSKQRTPYIVSLEKEVFWLMAKQSANSATELRELLARNSSFLILMTSLFL